MKLANRFHLLAAGAVSVSLMLTACGGGDDETGSSQVDTVSPPANVSWVASVGCLTLPVSTTVGPHSTMPVPSGYEHSPQGAVLAAINAQGWLAGAGDNQWTGVAQQLVAPGPGKDQWVEARTLLSVEGCVKDAPKFAGFKVDNYTDDTVTLALAARTSSGQLYAMPTQLVWRDGDWKIVLPTQSQAEDAVSLNNLDQFTAFGPDSAA